MNTKKSVSTNSAIKEQNKNQLPLLYKSLVPLSKVDHKDLTYDDTPGFLHAAATNALPILLNEFIMAEKHYPIFFSNLDEAVPLVAVGPHDENRNMFIDGDGKWKRGYYVPSYLLRYPFVLIKTAVKREEGKLEENLDTENKQESFVLAFDDKSDHITSTEGKSLFTSKSGKPLIDGFIERCKNYAQVGNLTQNFIKALKDNDLLAWQSITRSSTSGGESETIFSFVAVNTEKFAKLEDAVILDFYKKGWLPLIYSHIASLSNWTRIIQEEY